ncbi:polyphosphate glucokinase [Deinococcus aquiradiocola]|uniref:Polyphosphate glucokinase n=1 Tax=Deinococcus aquiradiocola TaxID=393059 RepID=A0A917UUE3_9DEIO|nr:polyphosphate glucokinase [Deinococcus aquiradiocola]
MTKKATAGAQAQVSGVLGIDIGGSGIKGAPVDLRTGTLLAERVRIPTPEGARPEDVTAVVAELAGVFPDTSGPIGVTFPGIVRGGVTLSAANVDKGWIGLDADDRFSRAVGRPVTLLNDADAAGLAEARFGAGAGVPGVVMMLTFGTGIGSALMYNGVLVPNTELGHIELNGREVEPWASGAAKDREDLSWKQWAKRATEYLEYLERLFSPDLFIIGGGLSKKADKWQEYLKVKTPVKPAGLQNEAGIVGAALMASERRG